MSIGAIKPTIGSAMDSAREGMNRANRQFQDAAAKIAGGEVNSSRMVDMIVSERMFDANASVVRAQDRMVGSLLDVRR